VLAPAVQQIEVGIGTPLLHCPSALLPWTRAYSLAVLLVEHSMGSPTGRGAIEGASAFRKLALAFLA
jgi:hypothetical protein